MNDPFDIRPTYHPTRLKDMVRLHKTAFGNKPILTKERCEELEGRKLDRAEYRRITRTLKPSAKTAKLELEICQRVVDGLPENARLACLSEIRDNIPMWAHYADNHRGICIEYRVRPDLMKPKEDVVPLKVDYVDQRPVITTEDIFHFSGRGKSGEPDNADRIKVFESMYLKKGLSWEYEQEWRVFEHSEREARYNSVPSLEPVSLSLGIHADEQTCETLVSIVGGRVPIYRLSMDTSVFGFTQTRIV